MSPTPTPTPTPTEHEHEHEHDPEHEHGPLQAWCLFRIDGRAYAVRLDTVVEVVESEGLVRLPLGPPGVLGLCVYHRDVLAVMALDPEGARPSHPPRPDPRPLVLILRGEGGNWGIRIDRDGTVIAHAPLVSSTGARGVTPGRAAIVGWVDVGGTEYAVLDAEPTWRGLRERLQRWFRGDPGPGPAPHEPAPPTTLTTA